MLSTELKKAVILSWTKKRIDNNKNVILIINGETGCQPPGSKVLMADGNFKSIEKIKIGDLVYSFDTNSQPITSKVTSLSKYMSKITCDVISSETNKLLYSCSGNHLIPVRLTFPELYDKDRMIGSFGYCLVYASAMFNDTYHSFTCDEKWKIDSQPIKVKRNKSKIVYGITLDSLSQLYVTDNYMVTKNSGKTYAGLRYAVDCAAMFGTNFNIKNNVDFNFVELLKKMEHIEDNKNPGTVFFFEEVGAFGSGAGSKQWQTKANQFFSSFAQTSRHLRQIFIMTCPSFSNLQKDTRELCHMQWEMQGINTSNKHSYAKPRRIQVNRTSGKMYMKYLRFNDGDKRYTLKRLDVSLPPKDIIEDYEKAKNIFTSTLNQKIIDSEEPVKEVAKEQNSLMMERLLAHKDTNGLSFREIAKLTGFSMGYVQRVAAKDKIIT